MLVHGRNLEQKETHRTKYRDETSRRYLSEIRDRYDKWHSNNSELKGPFSAAQPEDVQTLKRRVDLLEEYKEFLDQQHYAEKFDSRSNLHSSVLEEFLYYLFRDLVNDFGSNALVGKSHTFKDLFFMPPKFSEMVKRPYGKIEKKDHDFVIGTTISASMKPSVPSELEGNEQETEDDNEQLSIPVEQPSHHSEVTVAGTVETHLFDIPAVAVECKTYLDKSMLEGSSRAAEELKARNPNGMYIVVMEWIKLSENINLRKYKVDQIYVLRKQKNTDREFRYQEGYEKKPIDQDVVIQLFEQVRNHLTADWTGGIAGGIERGWLL